MESSFKPIFYKDRTSPWAVIVPRPEPDTAIVLVRSDGSAEIIDPGDSLVRRHIKWRSYKWAYWVDLSEQTLSLQCSLPTIEASRDFQAEVHLTYRVCDPIAIVQRRLTNVRAAIEPLLIRQMRMISRRYPIGKYASASRAPSPSVHSRSTTAARLPL